MFSHDQFDCTISRFKWRTLFYGKVCTYQNYNKFCECLRLMFKFREFDKKSWGCVTRLRLGLLNSRRSLGSNWEFDPKITGIIVHSLCHQASLTMGIITIIIWNFELNKPFHHQSSDLVQNVDLWSCPFTRTFPFIHSLPSAYIFPCSEHIQPDKTIFKKYLLSFFLQVYWISRVETEDIQGVC